MSQPDALLEQLRSARITAPPELRERVRAIAATPPAPPKVPRALPWRRVGLVLAPAAVAVTMASALAYGLATSGGEDRTALAPQDEAQPLPYERGETAPASPPRDKAVASGVTADAAAAEVGAIPTTAGRTQLYEAELTLRVKDLSETTKRALRLTKSFGGYVRSVEFGNKTSYLVVRVPVGSVQAALLQFNGLGSIVGQHVSIQDIQPQIDARFRRLQALRLQIAKLQARIARATAAQKPVLHVQLTRLQSELLTLQKQQATIRRTASFATVSLELRTEAAKAAAPPSRVERSLDNAGTILLKEAIVVLYALIVGGPLLVLAAILFVAGRLARRRSNEKLLQS